MPKVKVNSTMDPEQVAKIDAYAKRMGLNRSAAITVLTNQALTYSDMFERLPQMLDVMDEIRGAKAQGSAPANAPSPCEPGRGGEP